MNCNTSLNTNQVVNGFEAWGSTTDNNVEQVGTDKVDQTDKTEANEPVESDKINENADISDWDDIDTKQLMKDAKTVPLSTPLKDRLQEAVSARHTVGNSIKNFFKKCGRGIMNAFRGIRGKRSFYHAENVETFDQTFTSQPARGSTPERSAWKAALPSEDNAILQEDQQAEGADEVAKQNGPVSFEQDELAAAFGLRGAAGIKRFTDAEIDGIRSGEFHLKDIKQNPGLQDCWFLSTLSAFLAKSGPGAIADLIHVPAAKEGVQPEHAFVKLGTNVYKVPLGIITGGGKSNVSSSKPWVQLLETAMQMHLVKSFEGRHMEFGESNPRLAFRNAGDAFSALQGCDIDHRQHGSLTRKATFDDVRDLLSAGRPVVLGSPKGGFFALSTGISPEHAVAVLSVDDSRGGGDRRVTVLDPYGHTTVLNEKDLKKFDLVAATPNRVSPDAYIDDDEEFSEVRNQAEKEMKSEIVRLGKDDEGMEFFPKLGIHVNAYSKEDLPSVKTLLSALRELQIADMVMGSDRQVVRRVVLDMIPAALAKVRGEGKSGDLNLKDWWRALALKGEPPSLKGPRMEFAEKLLDALYDKVCDDFLDAIADELDEHGVQRETVKNLIHATYDDDYSVAAEQIAETNSGNDYAKVLRGRFMNFLEPAGIRYEDKVRCLNTPGEGVTEDNFFIKASLSAGDLSGIGPESSFNDSVTVISGLRDRMSGTRFKLDGEVIYDCGSQQGPTAEAAIGKLKSKGFNPVQVLLFTRSLNDLEFSLLSAVGAAQSLKNVSVEVTAEDGDLRASFKIPLCKLTQIKANNVEVEEPLNRSISHEVVFHPDGTSECTRLDFASDLQDVHQDM